MTTALITPTMVREMGLNEQEYQQILDTLGREPTVTELGMFSVMWSEHCGYKYSRPVLALFKNYKEAQESGALENAGVIPLDENLGICFKIESHNHPSAVEPFQGAATGVGGILRDIFTMNARPVANLNSLRFGPLDDPHNRYLFDHAVAGIAHYGNCLHPAESFVWRDVNGVHFDTIGNFAESHLPQGCDTSDLTVNVETLSVDVATGRSCWKLVQRVFRRHASQLVKIKTSMGRTLHVTPDHPVMVKGEDGWQSCDAQHLQAGQQLPVVTRLPICDEASASAPIIDLLELVAQDQTQLPDVFVSLPETWEPTAEARAALRSVEPSTQRRFRYIQDKHLPIARFLQIEDALGVQRDQVCLFRRGKANHMRAILKVDNCFARLFGYYASEGCVSKNGNTYKIIFTFAHHECEYVEDVASALAKLGLRPCVERRASTIAVYATSWLLGHLIKNVWRCGDKSPIKQLPAVLFTWPAYLQREALKGALRGDGSLTFPKSGSHAQISFSSVSKTLFDQILALVQNEGAIPSLYTKPAHVGNIQGREYDCLTAYQFEINNIAGLTALADVFGEERTALFAAALKRYDGARYSFPRYQHDKDIAWVKVLSVSTQANDAEEPLLVYDVEVADTHLFATSSGIVTHNCVGVPTVAGEINFHACYSGNPLVNAMSVGVVERKRVASAAAKGVGNPVIYVGSSTGKDGIHGATFASVELGPDSESKRPNVQMGDPFLEKLLIEATLEALATEYVVGIQDMGAAGLTCATCETTAKAGTGMEIDVRKVPLREADMTPYEIMLSESQERMLVIAQAGTEQRVIDIFKKWGLNAAVIGTVTNDGLVRVKDNGETVALVPARALTNECPTYYLETEEPTYIKEVQAFDFSTLPEPQSSLMWKEIEENTQLLGSIAERLGKMTKEELLSDDVPPGGEQIVADLQAYGTKLKKQYRLPIYFADVLLKLLDSPNIASKGYVTEQYDSMVQTQTVAMPGSDAAILRIRGSHKGIAVKIDGNGRYGYLDPFIGGQIAVAEAARNVACVGARPAAVTDNLNFANPEKPTGFWQFRRSVEGIALATEAFGTPVVSGNVSFYNETPEYGPIFPTPTIGMLGILDDVNRRTQAAFRDEAEGDTIVLLTAYDDPTGGLGGSEYLSVVHGVEAGVPPRIDLDGEKRLHTLLLECIGEGMLASCHDISDGGLAICLAEKCIFARQGALVLLNTADFPGELPLSATLFGEAQGRVVATVRTEKQYNKLKVRAEQLGIRAAWIGTVGGDNLRIAQGAADYIDLPITQLSEVYSNAIPRRMDKVSAIVDNETGL